jgi:hypothetical protein
MHIVSHLALLSNYQSLNQIIMNYIEIAEKQEIDLIPKKGATPTQAINACIEFCKEHGICTTIDYNGFTMYIDSGSDLNQLVTEYTYWLSLQTERMSV